MAATSNPSRYRHDLMRDDLDIKGWSPAELFRRAKISPWAGYAFLRGVRQTARTAEALTKTLGKPAGYYLIRRVPVERAS